MNLGDSDRLDVSAPFLMHSWWMTLSYLCAILVLSTHDKENAMTSNLETYREYEKKGM